MFAQHWQLTFRAAGVRVTPMQGGMLLTIARLPGITPSALARHMDVEGPTLVEALDRLESSGLLQRVRRVEDRRSYALHLTTAGETALRLVERYVPAREAELLATFTAEERLTLLDLLQRVVRRAKESAEVKPERTALETS